jgi:hypothetical protein
MQKQVSVKSLLPELLKASRERQGKPQDFGQTTPLAQHICLPLYNLCRDFCDTRDKWTQNHDPRIWQKFLDQIERLIINYNQFSELEELDIEQELLPDLIVNAHLVLSHEMHDFYLQLPATDVIYEPREYTYNRYEISGVFNDHIEPMWPHQLKMFNSSVCMRCLSDS